MNILEERARHLAFGPSQSPYPVQDLQLACASEPPGDMLSHTAGPSPRASDSVGLGEGGPQICLSSRVMLMLLVQDHTSRTTMPGNKNFLQYATQILSALSEHYFQTVCSLDPELYKSTFTLKAQTL